MTARASLLLAMTAQPHRDSASSLRAQRSNPVLSLSGVNSGLLRRFAPRNDAGVLP